MELKHFFDRMQTRSGQGNKGSSSKTTGVPIHKY